MDLQKIGRFISLILRHKPETIGITFGEHGLANVDEPKGSSEIPTGDGGRWCFVNVERFLF